MLQLHRAGRISGAAGKRGGDGFEGLAFGFDAEGGFGGGGHEHKGGSGEIAVEQFGAGAGSDEVAEEGGCGDAADEGARRVKNRDGERAGFGGGRLR